MRASGYLSLLFLAACTTSDIVAVGICTRSSDCRSGQCVDGGCIPYEGGQRDASGYDGGLAFCDGSGPLVFAGDSTGNEVCAGDVAQTTFRYALCTCNSLALSSTLTTDSFDSRIGPYTMGMGGASVGVVGNLSTNGVLSIGGALTVAGSGGIMLSPTGGLVVRGDLASGGALLGNAAVSVLSNTRINGNISASSLAVGGSLTVPAARTISVSPGPMSVGSTIRANVSVPPPCDCGVPPRLDVAGFVQAQQSINDNATIGLATNAFAGLSATTSRSLPCGRYYVSALSTTGGANLTIDITGRVALFVDGDIDVSGNLTINLAAGAELDLFVAGDIGVIGMLRIGDATHPARTRVYVGGTQAIAISSSASIAANLYAPTSALQISGALEVFGSLFTLLVQASDTVTIHYDRAVLGAATMCMPAPGCSSCLDCGNQACLSGGVCGACNSDADCCSPLECIGGACTIEIF